MRIRTIETDPVRTIDSIGWHCLSTTIRLQVRLFGKWITILKWDRIA